MPPNQIPLEDDACDVIAKAMRGQDIMPQLLAQKAGISRDLLDSALRGDHADNTLEKIAPILDLSAPALVGLADYKPETQLPDGLYRFVTPFGHAGVNAYAVITDHKALIFDTGTDANPILRFLAENKLSVDALYITHHHHDHTAGIPSLSKYPIVYPEDGDDGDFKILTRHHKLTTLDVSGHADPARAYLYEGLDVPICIVGDSIFAGSMGGTLDHEKYQLSLKTARTNLLTLDPSTVLCPGHGPLTTVRNELKHNPFLNKCLKHC